VAILAISCELRYSTSFSLHVHDSLFEENHRFAKTIQGIIINEWNWEKEIERLKDNRSYQQIPEWDRKLHRSRINNFQ
jgi:hypothetical protein